MENQPQLCVAYKLSPVQFKVKTIHIYAMPHFHLLNASQTLILTHKYTKRNRKFNLPKLFFLRSHCYNIESNPIWLCILEFILIRRNSHSFYRFAKLMWAYVNLPIDHWIKISWCGCCLSIDWKWLFGSLWIEKNSVSYIWHFLFFFFFIFYTSMLHIEWTPTKFLLSLKLFLGIEKKS